ncbi:chorismate lyase [Rhodocyclus tenuis]|uniref:Probable chorismate pyruvate-lyase n=1 Tax=Rhodocyclus gracilis TaxID=2929842 RepID=A0ABX0WJD8_9RHOO|nr:chorismate lyase [Rhodocyclus gracilis]
MSARLTRRWQVALARHPDVPAPRSWLFDRGSLTARLRSCGHFSLQLLRQLKARPTPDEAASLHLDPRAQVWVRDVTLLCDGRPRVFAHTVLATQPRGPLTRWLARLGERSLGSLLFAHPGFERGRLHVCRIDGRHPLYAPACAVLGASSLVLWGRRSKFCFGAQSVLVTEIFAADMAGDIAANVAIDPAADLATDSTAPVVAAVAQTKAPTR